jgi:hypothetical protein
LTGTDDSAQNSTTDSSQNLRPEASNTGNLKRKDEESRLPNLPDSPKTGETGEETKRARTDGDNPMIGSIRSALGPGSYSRADS